jgi:hypothetical protein
MVAAILARQAAGVVSPAVAAAAMSPWLQGRSSGPLSSQAAVSAILPVL